MNKKKTGTTVLRRGLVLLFALLLIAAFSACGTEGKEETVYVAPESSEVPEQPETAAPEKVPDVEQRKLIEAESELWTVKNAAEPWFYAITDLDHNGRLEVIAASMQGTGLYTYANFYEVSEDYSHLVPCETSDEEWETWPDFIQESLPCYYDSASGRYAYVCRDLMRDGAAHSLETISAIWLENGHVHQQPLASVETLYTEGEAEPDVRYFDAEDNPLTQEEYENWEEQAFAGMEKSTLDLFWSEESSRAGDPGEETEELSVTITKNPRSETIAEGGQTWFIAHADNAESIHWQAVDPDGVTYTLEEAMEKHPGLLLQELELDTLGVSNIPASADGWGVQAVFEGPGGPAVTEPAYLYVS